MIVTFCHIFFLYPNIFYIGRKNICNVIIMNLITYLGKDLDPYSKNLNVLQR